MMKSFLKPLPVLVWIVMLSMLAACGNKNAAVGSAAEKTADKDPQGFVPGQIFADRLKKSLYGPELIVIPAGRFTLGAVKGDKAAGSQELPAHEVAIARNFAVTRAEITVAQYRTFIESAGYKTQADKQGRSDVFDLVSGKLVPRDKVNWQFNHIGEVAGEDYPVIHVSFDDAVAYTQWLSARTGKTYRLPTEAEWEYVLRAGSQTVFPFGKKLKDLRKGNLTGARDAFPTKRTWGNPIKKYADGYWGLAPVRQYASEPFGTFDMLGNASEWVEDCWHDNYRRAPANGEAWVNPGCARRVVRGSAWLSSSEQSRSSFRMPMKAEDSNARIGFRVIREL